MAAWGNALGGWRKQRRAKNGRFGSGGISKSTAKKASVVKQHRSAVRSSRAQYRQRKKEVRKAYLKSSRGVTAKRKRKNDLLYARVDHIDRKKDSYNANKKTIRNSRIKKTAIVVGSAAAVYGAYRLNEKRLDNKATLVLYHNTDAKVGLNVIRGKTDLRGSTYRDHKINDLQGKLIESRQIAAGKSVSVDGYHQALKKNGNPVFFTNTHRGIARQHYGSRVKGRSMTLKARYYGPVQNFQFDDFHFDNPKDTLVQHRDQLSVKRSVASNSLNFRAPTANPRSRGTNFAKKIESTENYVHIPENILKKNVKYSIASVKLSPAGGVFRSGHKTGVRKVENAIVGSYYLAVFGGLTVASRRAQEQEARKRRKAAETRARNKAKKLAAAKTAAKTKAKAKAGVVV